MKNSLVEAFNYKRKSKRIEEVNDYEIFHTKELLETLKTKNNEKNGYVTITELL